MQAAAFILRVGKNDQRPASGLAGQLVVARQLLAVTVSPSGTVIEEFIAASDGIIGGLRSKAFIREGNWAVLVQKESYAE